MRNNSNYYILEEDFSGIKLLKYIKLTSRPYFTENHLAWQYRNQGSFLYSINVNENLEGTQGMIHHSLVNGTKLLNTLKSETTYVSSLMRGTGAFEILYNSCVKNAIDKNNKFIWGFTALSNVWKKKLDFHVDESIIYEATLTIRPIFDFKFNLKSILRFCNSFRLSFLFRKNLRFLKKNENTHYTVTSNLSDNLPELANKLFKENNSIRIQFSKEFCKWRLEDNPELKYELITFFNPSHEPIAYAIINTKNVDLRISDFYIIDVDFMDAIFNIIFQLAISKKVKMISFFGNINHPKNRHVFDVFSAMGGKIELNKNMFFVLKDLENSTVTFDASKWLINGLWTEGFTY